MGTANISEPRAWRFLQPLQQRRKKYDTNDAGAPWKLASLRGRPQIVTMFFASCEYACPLLVHDRQRLEAALPENVRTNVGFVLVSFDSERDTPLALAAYRTNHQLAAHSTLLRGAPDDVLELGALLGVKFKKMRAASSPTRTSSPCSIPREK